MTDFEKRCSESYKKLAEIGLRPMASSLGQICGIKCVRAMPDDESEPPEFRLDTARGEFMLHRFSWFEVGLPVLQIGEAEVGYLDPKIVATCALLEYGAINIPLQELYLGKASHNKFPSSCPRLGADSLKEGDWIELRGMSRLEAKRLMEALRAPRCLDRFEHFCRHFAWLDENGDIEKDAYKMGKYEGRLMDMVVSCVKGYKESIPRDGLDEEQFDNHYSIFAQHRMDTLIKLARSGLI